MLQLDNSIVHQIQVVHPTIDLAPELKAQLYLSRNKFEEIIYEMRAAWLEKRELEHSNLQ